MGGNRQAHGGRWKFAKILIFKKNLAVFLEVDRLTLFFLESFSIPNAFLGCHFGAELFNKDNISSAEMLTL